MKIGDAERGYIVQAIDREKFAARRKENNEKEKILAVEVYNRRYSESDRLLMIQAPEEAFMRKTRFEIRIFFTKEPDYTLLRNMRKHAYALDGGRWRDPAEEFTREVYFSEKTLMEDEREYSEYWLELQEPLPFFAAHDRAEFYFIPEGKKDKLYNKVFELLIEREQINMEANLIKLKVQELLKNVKSSKRFLELWPDGAKYLPTVDRCSDIPVGDLAADLIQSLK